MWLWVLCLCMSVMVCLCCFVMCICTCVCTCVYPHRSLHTSFFTCSTSRCFHRCRASTVDAVQPGEVIYMYMCVRLCVCVCVCVCVDELFYLCLYMCVSVCVHLRSHLHIFPRHGADYAENPELAPGWCAGHGVLRNVHSTAAGEGGETDGAAPEGHAGGKLHLPAGRASVLSADNG